MSESDHAHHSAQMACLEVRGGNEPTDISLEVPGLKMHVLSRPYQQADSGGDVHYVSSCGTGRITRLLVADVAGHGNDVADTARVLRDLMRRYVNHIDQRTFVMRMNDEFTRLSQVGRFATAIVATFFAPNRELSLVNAGHPSPLLYRQSTGLWTLLDDDAASDSVRNIPLGILNQTEYEQYMITLEPGDAIICYTDSLSESRDASGELIGSHTLAKLAGEIRQTPLDSKWIESWLARVEALAPGNLVGDDLTVLMFHVVGGPVQQRFHSRIMGTLKMIAAPFLGRPVPWPEMTLKNLGGAIFPWLSNRK